VVFCRIYTRLFSTILSTEVGLEKHAATLIAEAVFNKLKSTNVRECVRMARLAGNDMSKVHHVIDAFAKYNSSAIKNM
jgi:hypothetical protein